MRAVGAHLIFDLRRVCTTCLDDPWGSWRRGRVRPTHGCGAPKLLSRIIHCARLRRRMRKLTHKDWTGSYPGTNVLWLLYLTELLLSSEKPIPGATAAQKRNLREYKKRLSGYSCCSEVIWDELFEGLWAIVL